MANIDVTYPAEQIMPPPNQLWRMSVDRYHQLIDSGVLTPNDKIELVQGWIVEKMPHNPPHASVVRILQFLLARLLPAHLILQTQLPITLSDSEPEPDLAIVRGELSHYNAQHPSPDDVALVIEVSHATLALDRTFKQKAYAQAGIPVYWIVDVASKRIELYEEPDKNTAQYNRKTPYYLDDTIPVAIVGEMVGKVAVADLFPG